jgi:hydroxymethylpyrimidine pyrophosphatase-like HAD family hydrolase/energy-coupling factor transporter ATP-binding protein EcfA2
MRYHALACDYDGTLACAAQVAPPTLAALERLRATGRKTILVTGRDLEELQAIFPEMSRFDAVVAENGAVLYRPASREVKLLGPAPPPELMEGLRRKQVAPVAVGRVIVATRRPHETAALQVIHDLGLELHVVFNKGAVMILPTGINKATGLEAALKTLGLSPHEVVGIGDAENDHAFLAMCECAVAVANALPALKDHADLVTQGHDGAGVVELIDAMLDNDLRSLTAQLSRHDLVIGADLHDQPVRIASFGPNVLIAGPSGSGKSTAATSLLERLAEQRYQYCIIDPEGDYEALAGCVTLGNHQRSPDISEVLQVLAEPSQNVVVNLVGLPIADRPSFFLGLLLRLQEMRAQNGRPHWLLVDEAHHLLPAAWEPGSSAFAQDLNRTVFVTVHPDQVAPIALASVGVIVAVGASPQTTIDQFCRAARDDVPDIDRIELEAGEVVFWPRWQKQPPARVRIVPSKSERRRHVRKYAEGEMAPERSFYFRGPEGKLNLRAQNFIVFLQLADGVDDATWLHHLRHGDYSRWLREKIKDEPLAAEVEAVERRRDVSPKEGRALIRQAVERHYTLPAATPPAN